MPPDGYRWHLPRDRETAVRTAHIAPTLIAEAEKKTSECGPIARVTQAASVSLLCLCRGTRGQAAPFWRVPGAALNSVPGVITGRATLATNC
eukprot:scaffold13576_cov125-Isochrysis_galbana.AAC.7